MRKVTLKDVSKEAGFSAYTVSKILNGEEHFPAATVQAVKDAAARLNYVPNRAAKMLKTAANSDTVSVITADTSNLYYLTLMSGIQQVLQPEKWTIVLSDIAVKGHYDPKVENRLIKKMIELRCSGVIATVALQDASIELLDRWNIPLVFVDSPKTENNYYPSATNDNFAGSTLVGEHLQQKGYSNWLMLLYPAMWSTRFERLRGIEVMAAKCGARLTVLECDNHADSAFKELCAYFDAGGSADALIAGNNTLVLGVMRWLKSRRLRPGQDLGLITYDDFAWAEFTDPPLTLVDEEVEKIGISAAELLLKQIAHYHSPQELRADPALLTEFQLMIKPRLIVRQSC